MRRQDRVFDLPADAPLPPAPEPGRPRKPTLRRYSWSRAHHDLPGKDEWALVAEMAGSERARVEALVWRLDIYASANRPRGSLDGFPLRALAATWQVEADELARIMVALEHPDVGWLEDGEIVTFWERNPDEEDPTAALRARRSRARRQIVKAMQAKGAPAGQILTELERRGLGDKRFSPQVTGSVTCDAVTVTTRSDQIRGSGAGAVDNCVDAARGAAAVRQGQEAAEELLNPQAEAAGWLLSTGKRIVTERLGCVATLAETRIERWRRDLADDAVLQAIVEGAERSDYIGARFHNLVVDGIKRAIGVAVNGEQLRMGPTAIAAADRRRAG